MVSAIISKNSFEAEIIKDVQNGFIVPLFDKRILSEYIDVLQRPKHHFPKDAVENLILSVVNHGAYIKDVKTTEKIIPDPKDIEFYEVYEATAFCSSYIITGNLKHFPNEPNIINANTYYTEILEKTAPYIKEELNTKQCLLELRKTGRIELGSKIVEEILNKCFENKELNIFEELLNDLE